MTISELESLIHSSGKDIYSFCEQLTRSRIEAEELYQDIFLQAVQKLDKIDIDNNPKSYLLSIAVMLWKNKKRKRAWRARIAPEECLTEEKQEEFSEETTPEGYVIEAQEVQILKDELKMLSDKYQIPLVLYYMEEQSVTEIAKVMKLPKGTVKSRLYKARIILKERLIQRGLKAE